MRTRWLGLLWLCLVAVAPGAEVVPLLQDPDFARGFRVFDPQPGKHVERGRIQPNPALGAPVWGLDQWSSRFTLAGAAPERSTMGPVTFANPAKQVVFDPTNGLGFRICGSVEYGARLRDPAEPWVHLLAEQMLTNRPALANLAALHFQIQWRLVATRSNLKPEQEKAWNAAQFQAFMTIQNLNRQHPGYSDFLWFGIPMYDSRYPQPLAHAALDPGTGKFIYSPAGSVYASQAPRAGQWNTIRKDLLPLIQKGLETAWKQGFLTNSHGLGDFRASTFNIGWELPGNLDAEIQFRNLRLEAELKP